MPTAVYKVTVGNRDYSAPDDGGGSDTATFTHAKGWNGSDIRDVWARLDLISGTAPPTDATVDLATIGMCSTSTTTNDCALDLHWFGSPPNSFTIAWSRASTTLSTTSTLVSIADVPDNAYATATITSWFASYLVSPEYVEGGPIGMALLGDAGRSEQITVRTYDSNPSLALYIEVTWSEASTVELDTSGLPYRVKVGGTTLAAVKDLYVEVGGAAPGLITPTITDQPDDVSVDSGVAAVLSATATDWASVQWQVLDGTWQNAIGSVENSGDTTTYTSNPAGTWHDGRQYRVIFTSSDLLSATSDPATVTVNDGGAGGDGFSDQVIWRPTSVTGWARHTQSGHELTDLIAGSDVNGLPALPDLSTKVTHHPGDKFPAGGGARAEWRPQPDIKSTPGEEYWIGWFFYLPPGYPNPNSWGRIMGQAHGGSGSPTWAVRHDPSGSLKLDIRGGDVNANLRQPELLPSLARGHVYRYKMFVRSSTSSTGLIRVWIDGVRRGDDFTGPNLYIGSGGYLKFGVYGSDTGSTTQIWIGGWVKSALEADIDFQHSRYTG